MEFVKKHGMRLEAVTVAEEAKHGHGLLYVQVLPEEGRFKVAHVPLAQVPDGELRQRVEATRHLFDKIFFVLLKEDDVAMRVIRVDRAHSKGRNSRRMMDAIIEEPDEGEAEPEAKEEPEHQSTPQSQSSSSQ